MIKVEVIERFTLEDYKKLKNVKKVTNRKENEFGVKDTFECDEKMVDYLTGNNALNKVVVKVVEVMPEKKTPVGESVQPIEEVKEDKVVLKADSIKLGVKENVENITIEPSIILNGKEIARHIKIGMSEEKPKKTTKKKTSKKEVK